MKKDWHEFTLASGKKIMVRLSAMTHFAPMREGETNYDGKEEKGGMCWITVAEDVFAIKETYDEVKQVVLNE